MPNISFQRSESIESQFIAAEFQVVKGEYKNLSHLIFFKSCRSICVKLIKTSIIVLNKDSYVFCQMQIKHSCPRFYSSLVMM